MVFAILSVGLHPRFALERADGGELRLRKILDLIRSSRFGIHDLSRCKSQKKGQYARLNMPLELGYDLGSKEFGAGRLRTKKILVLESVSHELKKAASDLAGCDCEAHQDEPLSVVRIVRDWLVQEAGVHAKGATSIWNSFNDFMAWNSDRLTGEGWSDAEIDRIRMSELRLHMENWLDSTS